MTAGAGHRFRREFGAGLAPPLTYSFASLRPRRRPTLNAPATTPRSSRACLSGVPQFVAREVYGIRETWEAIEALDGRVEADIQISMLQETRKLVERAARWLLRNRPRPLDIARDIEHFAVGVRAFREGLRDLVAASSRGAIDAAADRFVECGATGNAVECLPSQCYVLKEWPRHRGVLSMEPAITDRGRERS